MAEILQPDTLARMYDDLDRRLRNLESSPRVGLSGIAAAEVIGPASDGALLVDGIYRDLTSGGPAVSLATGTKAIVIGSAILYLGPTAVYKNWGSGVSYRVSGATTLSPNTVFMGEGKLNFDGTSYIDATVSFVDLVTLNKGTNTFTMQFKYETPSGGGAASTLFQNMTLVVVPLNL